MTVFLVLPAYNEEANLGGLLAKVSALDLAVPLKLLVVNDGSRDRTAEVAAGFVGRLDLERIDHASNLGLGAALRTGLEAALARGRPGDVVVTMDADDTQPPSLIPAMLVHIAAGADVVVASRFASGGQVAGVPWYRRALSRGAAIIARRVVPVPGVRDFTSGYRAYRFELLAQAHEVHGARLIEESGFACMLELLLKLARAGARFAEAPLELGYNRKLGASKMRVLSTVKASLRVLWRARRRG